MQRIQVSSKIAAIELLMVVAIALGQTTSPSRVLERDFEAQIHVNGDYPKVGEVFEAVFKVRLKSDGDLRHLPEEITSKGYVVFFGGSRPKNAVEVLGEREIFVPVLHIGEWREFIGTFLITRPENKISFGAGIRLKAAPGSGTGRECNFYLIDSETGQYGTREEYEKGLPVEYRYDPVDGSFTCSPSQNPAPVEENRRIIKLIKQLEPRLSDSLALLLHSDQYRVGVPKGLPRWDEQNQRWLEGELFEYYLKDGWFESLRAGKHDEWLREEKKKIEDERREGSFNFFRDNNSSDSNCRSNNDNSQKRIWKDFYGQWWFKDHNYNKDQGLLADASQKPIINGKARLLMTYTYDNTYYRVLSNYNATDSSGWFHIAFDTPQGATNCNAYPIIYPSGPDSNSPKVNVSDPNITQPSYWKDADDSTLFIMRELGFATPHQYFANDIPCTLGVIWTDTFPQVSQPQSACINIYEIYLHARTFMNPPPTRPLRVMWEPGYQHGSAMNMTYYAFNDTIWVKGDTNDTDEWDDDVLLHEFGHYLMKGYAQGPPSDTGGHAWPISYPERPGLAYGEGWAHFFSARARAGSGTDTLIVNTGMGIAGDSVYLWHNIENPWVNSDFWPDSFIVGGPWCEGTVAGALWDVYDSHDEDPFPSYPYPGFPDTALTDTLTVDFDTIWTIFDNYNPPGEPTNCWTIFHFQGGWNCYNYDHEVAFDQILVHHRIRDSVPPAPDTLTCTRIGDSVNCVWSKVNVSDLKGYRLHRRWAPIGPGYWTSWSVLVDNESPNDTTHRDTTTVLGRKYQYKVTAYDSLGNESDYSIVVEVRLETQANPKERIGTDFGMPSVMTGSEDLMIKSNGARKVHLKVYDCLGRLINEKHLSLEGSSGTKVDITRDERNIHLASGVYFLHYETDLNEEGVRKFVIIH